MKGYPCLEEPPGQKEAKEGNQLLKIPRMHSSTGSRRKVNLSFMKVRRSQATGLYVAQEEILEEPVKEAQIQPEEELEEINLGAELGS